MARSSIDCARLPDGVGNAEAEAILPHASSEKIRPPQPDGSWRDWTTLQFSDFFRMRLMAQSAGLRAKTSHRSSLTAHRYLMSSLTK